MKAHFFSSSILKQSKRRWPLALGAALIFGYIFFYSYFIQSPYPAYGHSIIKIEKGETVGEIAVRLENEHVIRSPFLFKLALVLTGGEKRVVAGDYYFDNGNSFFGVVSRITHGRYGIAPLVVTIPEGSTLQDIANLIKLKIPDFDQAAFLKEAAGQEGYLFPDTYGFLPNVLPSAVVAEMHENFMLKTKALEKDIAAFGKPLKDIVTMASIIEGEARQSETMRIVSGILWKRISMGMPLQVDATFRYINGKTTAQLTTADLLKDSVYNTYTRKGLPPTPISNPGLDSIMAALHPTKTAYIFFLTDNNGVMHYAKTHDEHVANKEKYLRNS